MAKPTHKRPAAGGLDPVDWHAIHPHYIAGIRSLTDLSRTFGVSRAGIIKHATKHAWQRNLKPSILQRSDALLARVASEQARVTQQANALVTDEVTFSPSQTEKAVIEANAAELTAVRLWHRQDVARLRTIVRVLMDELGSITEQPELAGMIYMALSDPDVPALAALEQMAAVVRDLPTRTKVAKDLADTLHKVIGMEREAFGLDTTGGTDGLVKVKVIDFTGKGDPDGAPPEDPNTQQDD